MEVQTTSYVYRERYPLGRFVHNVLCRVLGESCVFRHNFAFEDEIEIQVTGDYTPGHPGNPSFNPDRYDPPTPEEIEDIQATRDGKPFELTAKEEDTIAEELLEAGRDEYADSFDGLDYDDYYDQDLDRDCDYWNRVQ